MPIISIFFGIIIRVFHLDHDPPHIHATYSGQVAAYDIRTRKKLYGKLPKRAERLVKEWLKVRRIDVKRAWESARKHQAPSRVKPLE